MSKPCKVSNCVECKLDYMVCSSCQSDFLLTDGLYVNKTQPETERTIEPAALLTLADLKFTASRFSASSRQATITFSEEIAWPIDFGSLSMVLVDNVNEVSYTCSNDTCR